MPRTATTVGWTDKGSEVLIKPDVPIDQHIKAMNVYKTAGVPEGFSRVERWESDRGIAATALSHTATQHAAQERTRQDEADAAAAKAREEKILESLHRKKKAEPVVEAEPKAIARREKAEKKKAEKPE